MSIRIQGFMLPSGRCVGFIDYGDCVHIQYWDKRHRYYNKFKKVTLEKIYTQISMNKISKDIVFRRMSEQEMNRSSDTLAFPVEYLTEREFLELIENEYI